MLFQQIRVGPLGTNCYLLGDEEAGVCCVVDPGSEPERVVQLVRGSGLSLQYILLTHGHFDHTDGIAGVLAQFPQVPVYLNGNDLCPTGGNQEDQYAGAGENQQTYDDGDTLPLGAAAIRVLRTPGHSPGSVVLLWGDVMLSGDTLFAGTCGRCDLLGGSMEEMFASLKRLGALEGDFQVYPGHGHATTLETERRTNPYMRQAMQR